VQADVCALLPQTGWTLAFVDSQETASENGAAVNAFDGNPATKWHTRWSGANPPAHPHEIRIDTGSTRTLCGFNYLPRQDGGANGTIKDYEFAVSVNGTSWTTVASGVLVSSASNLSERSVPFTPTPGRYIRLRALSAVNGGIWTTAAEIKVKGSSAPAAPQPPVATIDQPVAASVTPGGTLQFAGTATDPDNALPLTLSWTFPSCASPASSTAEDPGAVVFNCAAGSYPVTFQVCDAQGLCDTEGRTIAVQAAVSCDLLSPVNWSLVFVDSQETAGESAPAVNAFDQNSATKWHTRWSGSNPPGHPHEIRIDTGATRTLCGFNYLPRQDGGVNGTIKNYEFAVSVDGTNWTTVSSGVLVSSGANLAERAISFSATTGRYIRLRSLSEVNNGPWASAGEIRVKGQ
jgi:hypothetical protein